MSPSFRHLAFSLLAAVLVPLPASAASSIDQAWQSAATFRSNEAYTEFTKVSEAKNADSREVNLGLATSLIGVQPRTASNIDRATSLCQQLVQENPDDRIGLLATYLLARIEQFHRQPPDLKKAGTIYRQLAEKHPDSVIGQISASKLAVLLLFGLDSSPAERKASLADLENLLKKIPTPEARRDTLIVMGNACIWFKLGDDKALRYLIEAEEAKISSSRLRADTLIQIGTTALNLNRRDLAIQYYEKFVNLYKRDARNFLVRQKIAQIKSGS